MKKILYLSFLIFALSCNRDLVPNVDFKPALSLSSADIADLNEAKVWFTNNHVSGLRVGVGGSLIVPDWKNVVSHGYYLELPLLFNDKLRGAVLTGNNDTVEGKNNLGQSLTHILIFKNQGTYNARIIEIIPTKPYVEQNLNLLKSNKLHLQNLKQYSFTGALLTYTLEYKLLNLTRYIKGRGMSQDENQDLYIQTSGGRASALLSQCFNVYRDVYERQCIGSDCSGWVLVTHTFLYGYCVADGGGPGGGGGGGTSPDPIYNGVDFGGAAYEPVPRNSTTALSALQKFVCPGGVPPGVTIHPTYEPSYLTAAAHIHYESGDQMVLLDGRSFTGLAVSIPGEGIHIWLAQDAFNRGEFYLASVIGHELVHAKHIRDKGSNHNTSAGEYAAYQWQIDFFNKHTEYVKAEPALKQMVNQLINKRNIYTKDDTFDMLPCF